MLYEGINESLRVQVGLERLYPYTVEHDLISPDTNRPLLGMANTETGCITLTGDMRTRQCASTYLHEVGHIIASIARIDQSPGSSVHNQYFATLVAVMYRRSNLFDRLKVYDFCETDESSYLHYPNSPPPAADDELIKRFSYVLRKSARFAQTALTIEQIAGRIFKEDVFPAWENKPSPARPKKIAWSDLLLGIFLGVSLSSAAVVAAAIVFLG